MGLPGLPDLFRERILWFKLGLMAEDMFWLRRVGLNLSVKVACADILTISPLVTLPYYLLMMPWMEADMRESRFLFSAVLRLALPARLVVNV